MLQQTINFGELTLNGPVDEGYLQPQNGSIPLMITAVITIGRAKTSDLPLNDTFVSQEHCRIEKRSTGFFIQDLGSTNGTFVNGLRISEVKLLNGSQIQVGQSDFIFRTEKPASYHEDLPLKTLNAEWRTQLLSIKQLATSDLPVFLQGESGSGKEVIAHLIHDQSNRGEKPFVSVNCSALTETLVESELFGHIKGAYTGATSDRKGAFEAARGGTLFLDEIGDLPLSLQPKLLRALENQEIKPVGSDKIIKTNVRIITATHKHLESLVSEKMFRADLYFRINVVKLTIPALRDRLEDFDDLLYYFAKESHVRFSVTAINELKKHLWPGNIRELKNVVARAKALFNGSYIHAEQVTALIDKPLHLQTYTHLLTPDETSTQEVSKPSSANSVLKEV
jgi:transcriptional regulator with PAS, ATPase and Fis domain